MKSKINWSNVAAAFIIPTLVVVAECLFIAWTLQISE